MLKDLGADQPFAHDHAGFKREVGALLPFLFRKSLNKIFQVIDAKGNVACFIANHQVDNLLEKRVMGGQLEGVEGRQSQALNDDLHADEFQVPARIGKDLVEQCFQVGVHRIQDADLFLQVPGEHFNVSGLVKSLTRRIELGIVGRRATG